MNIEHRTFNIDGPVKSPEKDLIAKLAQGKSDSYKVTSFGFDFLPDHQH